MRYWSKKSRNRARLESKATNQVLTPEYLAVRKEQARLSRIKLRWVEFCETMMKYGLTVTLYEARRTVSKYVTVTGAGKKPFKVRFSNHKPIRYLELGDSDVDCFVGVTHTGIRDTQHAINQALMHFEIEPETIPVEEFCFA